MQACWTQRTDNRDEVAKIVTSTASWLQGGTQTACSSRTSTASSRLVLAQKAFRFSPSACTDSWSLTSTPSFTRCCPPDQSWTLSVDTITRWSPSRCRYTMSPFTPDVLQDNTLGHPRAKYILSDGAAGGAPLL